MELLRRPALVALFSTALLVAAVAVPAAAETTVGRWDRFEATVKNERRYADPIRDVTLAVTYTRPDGRKVRFLGFHDGGDTWRLRFMPDAVGVWKYDAAFSDGSGRAAGQFRCVPSELPGLVSRYEPNPRWFGFRGGAPLLVRGFHVGHRFGSPAWDDPEDPNDGERRKAFLDWAVRQGYNMLSVNGLLQSKQTSLLWPPEPASYRKVERILEDAAARRIVIYPFFGFFPKGGAKLGADEQRAYLRYAIARFGPFWNLVFNVAGPEPNVGTGWMPPEEVRRLGREIRELDVFGHLLGVHNADGDDPHRAEPWASYVTLQGEFEDLRALNRYLLSNAVKGKPVYAHETLWAGNVLQPWQNADAATVRRHAWVHALSAASLNFGDQRGRNDSGFSASMDPKDANPAWHEAVKKVWDFVATLPFHKMTPRPDLTSDGACLAEAGKRYLVYLPDAGPDTKVTLRLPRGRWSVEWVNAADTAERVSSGTRRDGTGLVPPRAGEWLLQVTAAGARAVVD